MTHKTLAAMTREMLPNFNGNAIMLGEFLGLSDSTIRKVLNEPGARVTTTTYRAILNAYRTFPWEEPPLAEQTRDAPLRQCVACKSFKPLEVGFFKEKGPGGYGTLCKRCRKEQRRQNVRSRNERAREVVSQPLPAIVEEGPTVQETLRRVSIMLAEAAEAIGPQKLSGG